MFFYVDANKMFQRDFTRNNGGKEKKQKQNIQVQMPKMQGIIPRQVRTKVLFSAMPCRGMVQLA